MNEEKDTMSYTGIVVGHAMMLCEWEKYYRDEKQNAVCDDVEPGKGREGYRKEIVMRRERKNPNRGF
jgi:hypothetical protein